MSQLDSAKNAASADQLYFDITVSNFKSTTTKPPVFYFNESRTLPFIRNPEEYYLSILRFTMETGSIPVFIPSIQPNQGDRDKTLYSFTLEYTADFAGASGTTYTSNQEKIRSSESSEPPARGAGGLPRLEFRIERLRATLRFTYAFHAREVRHNFHLSLNGTTHPTLFLSILILMYSV
jgi:hypothetical protein